MPTTSSSLFTYSSSGQQSTTTFWDLAMEKLSWEYAVLNAFGGMFWKVSIKQMEISENWA